MLHGEDNTHSIKYTERYKTIKNVENLGVIGLFETITPNKRESHDGKHE